MNCSYLESLGSPEGDITTWLYWQQIFRKMLISLAHIISVFFNFLHFLGGLRHLIFVDMRQCPGNQSNHNNQGKQGN